MIKQWALEPESVSVEDLTPLNTIVASHALTSIDHHWVDAQFATSGDSVYDATIVLYFDFDY